ncbi:DUF2889 domain-containing protein [Pseudomonas sp. Milli4]|uniref:DUF2889 domain-containing protein n=2 Tax=Pseudomonas schmalbachii TaxID=2816993 RepID=A0ABS3TK11_9PSED|nr:DUF2889 domain-containing protein [Pseudomonas schmalbachii]
MAEHASENQRRRLLHTRQVSCEGYLREDGLFEFEGRLRDTKSYDTTLLFSSISANQPVHQMLMIMTVDRDLVIHDLKAVTEAGPTPFCRQINGAYAALKGLRIGPGFKKRLLERVGGEQGCTHLTELLGPMATTVYQTVSMLAYGTPRERAAVDRASEFAGNKWVIGTCHAYQRGGEAERRLLARSRYTEPMPLAVAND